MRRLAFPEPALVLAAQTHLMLLETPAFHDSPMGEMSARNARVLGHLLGLLFHMHQTSLLPPAMADLPTPFLASAVQAAH